MSGRKSNSNGGKQGLEVAPQQLGVRRWDVSTGEADDNIADEGLQRESPEHYTD